MEYKITFEIREEFVNEVVSLKVKEVVLDLSEKEGLTSKEIKELLILSKNWITYFSKTGMIM